MGTLTMAALLKCGVIILVACAVFVLAKVAIDVYGKIGLINGDEVFYLDVKEMDRSEEETQVLHAQFYEYLEDKKAGLPVKLTEEMKDSFVPLNLRSCVLIALRDALDIVGSIIVITMLFITCIVIISFH